MRRPLAGHDRPAVHARRRLQCPDDRRPDRHHPSPLGARAGDRERGFGRDSKVLRVHPVRLRIRDLHRPEGPRPDV